MINVNNILLFRLRSLMRLLLMVQLGDRINPSLSSAMYTYYQIALDEICKFGLGHKYNLCYIVS